MITNFYKECNQWWLETAKIPTGKNSVSNFSIIRDKINKRLLTLIAKNDNSMESRTFRTISSLSKATKSNHIMNELNILVNKVNSIDCRWEQIAFCVANGINNVYDISIDSHKNRSSNRSSKRSLYISQSGLTLPNYRYYQIQTLLSKKEIIIQDEYLKLLRTIIRKSNTFLGKYTIYSSYRSLFEFERKISKIHINLDDYSADFKNNPTKVITSKLISKILCNYFKHLSITEIEQEDLLQRYVIMESPYYLRHLQTIIDETDKRVWQDYQTLKIVLSYAGDVGNLFDDDFNTFFSSTLERRGATKNKKSEIQLEVIKTIAGETLGECYRKKYFNRKRKLDIENLIHSIKFQMYKSITSNDWMSEETKQEAINKLNKMKSKIYFSQELILRFGLNTQFIGNKIYK